MGKYEVTFDEWDACAAGGGCNGYRPGDRGWGRGRRPVIYVSWLNALKYVHWLSRKARQKYRLLTEAEWEYTARAGTTTARFWGHSDNAGCLLAQHANAGVMTEKKRFLFFAWTVDLDCQRGYSGTAPVGSFQPNSFGLHDMLGNVWEWVEECLTSAPLGQIEVIA